MRLVKIEKEDAYSPISCTYHDHLEHYATRRDQVTIVVNDAGNERVLAGVRISDIINEKGGEFIQVVASGVEMLIRLDAIISVEDKVLADFTD